MVELKITKLNIDCKDLKSFENTLKEINEERAVGEEVAIELNKQKTYHWRIKNRFKKDKIPKATANNTVITTKTKPLELHLRAFIFKKIPRLSRGIFILLLATIILISFAFTISLAFSSAALVQFFLQLIPLRPN